MLHWASALGALSSLSPVVARASAKSDPDIIAHRLADVARREYHDASTGRRIADGILRYARRGRYRNLPLSNSLAEQLTTDAQSIAHDKHFMVMHGMEMSGTA